MLVLFVLMRKRSSNERKEPPGPRGLPFLGFLGCLTKRDFLEGKCVQWAKTYGNIVRIKVGSVNVVLLNDLESMKKFLNKKEILYRPNKFFLDMDDNVLPQSNGESWEANRRFVLHVLRDLGFGRTRMKHIIEEEVQRLSDRIAMESGDVVPIHDYLVQTSSNIIAAFVFGHYFPLGDPGRKCIDENLPKLLEAFDARVLSECLPPWLKKIDSLTSPSMATYFTKLYKLTCKEIEEHKKTFDEDNDQFDLIAAYLTKIKENEGLSQPLFRGKL